MATITILLALICFSTFKSSIGEEVCHPPYGCFSDDAPFHRALVKLPRSPKVLNNKFIMHTRETWNSQEKTPYMLDPENPETVRNISFDGTKKTTIFSHGYLESSRMYFVKTYFNEILKQGDMNVIFVDWEKGATFPYYQASGDTRIVGRQIARLVDMFHNETGLKYSDVHLIGFSLGAQVVGYAGRDVQRRGNKIGRISGLDPAGPFFEYRHPDVRLDPTDADFVDVAHLDSRTIGIKGMGCEQALGHVDFYFNGGFHQPGCLKEEKEDPIQIISCSHYRAPAYYLESIHSHCPFYAYPCKSYDDFKKGLCTKCPEGGCPRSGYHAIDSKGRLNGSFYLQTHDEKPWCAFHYKLTFNTGSKLLADFNGEVEVILTGTKGKTTINIDKSYYERDSTEVRVGLGRADVGEITRVKVKGKRLMDFWYLKSVVVKPFWTDKEYLACYDRWMSHNEVSVESSGVCPKDPFGRK